uniref:Uncharacterized protein n=1 Tax=Lactuca sativa TaxID=4236 RepID=A0A9R1VMW0_LACSA|nr:hypothetical protein LSAT_V11C500239370 [Lactuca sativa]
MLQALPQFGLLSPVRVCSNCYNYASWIGNSDGVASVNGVNSVTDSVSRLDISTPSNSNTNQSAAVDCKCGMPLCICEVPSNDDVAPMQARFRSILNPSQLPQFPVFQKQRKQTQHQGVEPLHLASTVVDNHPTMTQKNHWETMKAVVVTYMYISTKFLRISSSTWLSYWTEQSTTTARGPAFHILIYALLSIGQYLHGVTKFTIDGCEILRQMIEKGKIVICTSLSFVQI